MSWMHEPAGAQQQSGKTDRTEPVTVDQVVELRLYVAGQTPACVRAVDNLQRICAEHLAGRYRVELIDLIENPALAHDDEIIAIPTLVRRLPPPLRKLIGDLANTERVLVGLQLRPERGASP